MKQTYKMTLIKTQKGYINNKNYICESNSVYYVLRTYVRTYVRIRLTR